MKNSYAVVIESLSYKRSGLTLYEAKDLAEHFNRNYHRLCLPYRAEIKQEEKNLCSDIASKEDK